MVTETIENKKRTYHHKFYWSNEENEIVKLHFKNDLKSVNLIKDLINQQFNKNRSVGSIRHQARLLKLTKLINGENLWTEQEELIIQTYYNSTHANTLLIQEKIKKDCGIDRTIVAITYRAHILGLTIKIKSKWTENKLTRLRSMIGKYSAREISEKLHVPISAIHKKTQSLKYKVGVKHRTDWYAMIDLCKIFGVSSVKIKQWMHRKIIIYDEYQKGVYRFSKGNLKKFICTYALELNGRNTDLFQIVSILCPNYSSGKIDKYL